VTSPRRPDTVDEELLEAEAADVLSLSSDEQRVHRMAAEMRAAFRTLAGVDRGVAVFGSARTPAGHPEYELARATARQLGEAGLSVITGGGPGVMEAANRGAREAGAPSIGVGIELPRHRERRNPYVDVWVECHYFFVRKVMFLRYASGFVVFPGGFGTLDELFEALTLDQTGKVRHFPIVLMKPAYWEGLVGWVRERMVAEGKASPADLELFDVCDDPGECVRRLVAASERRRLVA